MEAIQNIFLVVKVKEIWEYYTLQRSMIGHSHSHERDEPTRSRVDFNCLRRGR